MEPEDERLREAILEVVRRQLADNEPPAARETLQRLKDEGYSEEEAMKLMGYVAATEVFDVLRSKRPYDEEKYTAALRALPRLPWDR